MTTLPCPTINALLKHKDRSLFGQPIAQSWASLYLIEQILKKEKPQAIVELGTSTGMLAMYLNCYSILSKTGFYSVDINIPEYRKNYNFKQMDVRSEACIEFVADLFNTTRGTCMLIIDAADPKSTDVNYYVNRVKKGTVVLAHDYITDEDKSFRWGWRDKDITCWDRLEKLEPYMSMSVELDARMFYGVIK